LGSVGLLFFGLPDGLVLVSTLGEGLLHSNGGGHDLD
jgi:hypothetical protein